MVLQSCAVSGCVPSKELRFRFPDPKRYKELFDKWVLLCNNEKLHVENITPEKIYNRYRVCKLHFLPKNLGTNNKLKKYQYPTQNLPQTALQYLREDEIPMILLPSASRHEDIQHYTIDLKHREQVSSTDVADVEHYTLQAPEEEQVSSAAIVEDLVEMGKCSAKYCDNSHTKGYLMKKFPKCPIRRVEWVKHVGRVNWVPTITSRLCEVHFAPEMWEYGEDKEPRLKPNAMPTIFGYYLKAKTFPVDKDQNGVNQNDNLIETKQREESQSPNENFSEINCDNDCSQIKIEPMEDETIQRDNMTFVTENEEDHLGENSCNFVNNHTNSKQNNSFQQNNNCDVVGHLCHNDQSMVGFLESEGEDIVEIENDSLENNDLNYKTCKSNEQSMDLSKSVQKDYVMVKKEEYTKFLKLKNELTHAKTEIKRLKNRNASQEHNLFLFRKKLRNSNNKIHFLEARIIKKSYISALSEVFTKDQIECLLSKKSRKPWSSETMERAIKLYEICGTKGYEEIQQQNLPFPSLRTIKRWLVEKKI